MEERASALQLAFARAAALVPCERSLNKNRRKCAGACDKWAYGFMHGKYIFGAGSIAGGRQYVEEVKKITKQRR